MLELSNSSHLLEQKSYKYQLQDVAEPQLYRDAFSYEEAPKIPFNHRRVPMDYARGDLDHRHHLPGRPAVHGALLRAADRGLSTSS